MAKRVFPLTHPATWADEVVDGLWVDGQFVAVTYVASLNAYVEA